NMNIKYITLNNNASLFLLDLFHRYGLFLDFGAKAKSFILLGFFPIALLTFLQRFDDKLLIFFCLLFSELLYLTFLHIHFKCKRIWRCTNLFTICLEAINQPFFKRVGFGFVSGS